MQNSSYIHTTTDEQSSSSPANSANWRLDRAVERLTAAAAVSSWSVGVVLRGFMVTGGQGNSEGNVNKEGTQCRRSLMGRLFVTLVGIWESSTASSAGFSAARWRSDSGIVPFLQMTCLNIRRRKNPWASLGVVASCGG